jgi:toxin ParE1/3/4
LRLEWRPRALADLEEIHEQIARDQPAAAAGVAERIIGASELLRVHPRLGRSGRAPSTRELVVARTPYLLIYRDQVEAVTILRVLHGAQNWP